ncbi:lipoate--protein ligase family protein [Candidatus Woesearchaeota archaeon CG_4_10_14_0_2_um_filter_57_5]|nr:MAG: hypothetical protein AUJ68_01635 [Candidatus Woesearchaeota archaeon CG1_02_57_44]PIZ52394.1 MAG: lipoate--protein ligase family protein [Candidatus Woesearchaeota archaeon CG_4_10_14_0_2_um_filter_57_5]
MSSGPWRIIPLETHDAFLNMALDEACSEQVAAGGIATIRLYRWQPSAVSIGCFQSMRAEIATERCDALGVDYVRRRTGGGAVYHDHDGEITYSVIAPSSWFSGITESYQLICGWVIDGLAELGISAQFSPINDIMVGDKKISGNAQTRRGGVLLQHGTLLYDVDVDRMFSLLRVGQEKIADKLITSVKKRVTRVLDHIDVDAVSREDVTRALLIGLTRDKQCQIGSWTAQELSRAEALAKSRYRDRGWNFSR